MIGVVQAREQAQAASFLPVIFYSLSFHVLVFLVIPLLVKMFHRPVAFERPRTFQLVQPPRPVTPPAPPPEPVAPPTPAPSPRPKVEKKPKPAPQSKPKPRPKEQPKEDLSELEELLGAVQPPAQVSAPRDFEYHWYLNAVRQKAERYWQPPMEDRNAMVEVAFTIFANGSISEARITRPSGNSVLDNLAKRAIMRAAPFGKLPPGFSGNTLELTCVFRAVRK